MFVSVHFLCTLDVLLSLGEDFKDSDIQDMIDEADLTGSGTVDFLEFIKMMPDNIQENYTKCVDREKDGDSILQEAEEPLDDDDGDEDQEESESDDNPMLEATDTAIIHDGKHGLQESVVLK